MIVYFFVIYAYNNEYVKKYMKVNISIESIRHWTYNRYMRKA